MLSKVHSRGKPPCFACLAGLIALAPGALAGGGQASSAAHSNIIEGSSPTHRTMTDQYLGSVYIYAGGFFPGRTGMTSLQFLFSFAEFGNTTGYITPLLFEVESTGEYTIYTVRGIARGFEVGLGAALQTLPFDVLEGEQFTTSAHFTFGFINALVDASGKPTANSMGTVEFDNPADTGHGQGGVATNNDWVASISQQTDVALGTTFGVSGSGATNTLFTGYRTYSARAGGIIITR